MEAIYSDQYVDALHVRQNPECLLVIFRAAAPTPRMPLEGFIRRTGISALGILPKSVNYYPAASMARIADAFRPFLRDYADVVTFGHSMGAYGAAKYGALFGASSGLAFSVQYSINPAHFPGYRPVDESYFDPALHRDMEVMAGDTPGRLFAFYDPLHVMDQLNATLVARASDTVSLVRMVAAGHNTIGPLRDGDTLGRAIDLCRAGDRAGLVRLAATARRSWRERLYTTARGAAARRPAVTDQVLREASDRLAEEHRVQLAIALAMARIARGEHDLARAVISRLANATTMQARTAMDMSHACRRVAEWPLAARWSQRWVDLAPDDPHARAQLARDLRIVGREQEADT